MATLPTVSDQLQTLHAQLTEQAPAEILEGFSQSIERLKLTDFASRAPQPGDTAPDLSLPDQKGTLQTLSSLLAEGPVVLIFYRGAWCPYCNVLVGAFGQAAEEFMARHAQLVAVSPQLPDHSLTMAEKHELPFAVLSDVGGQVMDRYGIGYEVDAETQEVLKAVGNDLTKFNGADGWKLPAPAVFLIDRDGTVRFARVDADYRQRAEPSEVLAALDELSA
jgi:peroxiredoxin